MSFSKVNKTTGELTRIAGNGDIPIDSTPTQGSTNAVQSGGTFSAIKAVSDNVEALSDEVSSVKSALTNNVNQNGCKNILPYVAKNVASYANIEFTPYDNGTVAVSNTQASAISDFYLFSPSNKNTAKLPINLERDADYTLSVSKTSKSVRLMLNFYDSDGNNVSGTQIETYTSTTFNLSTIDPNEQIAFYRAYLRVSNGETPSANTVLYPMICLATDYVLDSSYVAPSMTNRQLTTKKVGWDDYSELGAVNYFNNTASSPQTDKGVTYTVDATTKKITATGTNDGTANSFTSVKQYLKAGTYKCSGCPSGGSNSNYRIVWDVNDSQNNFDYGDGVIITLATDGYVTAYFNIMKDYAISGSVVFEPMITTLLDYNGPYVPYAPTNKECLPTATLKTVVAASSDFADFQTRIAAL